MKALMKALKKIAVPILMIIGFLFIISIDGLTNLAFPSKIVISKDLSLENFKNCPEIGQAIVDLYSAKNPKEWSENHPIESRRIKIFLDEYNIWSLKNPSSSVKSLLEQWAKENENEGRQIKVCLE